MNPTLVTYVKTVGLQLFKDIPEKYRNMIGLFLAVLMVALFVAYYLFGVTHIGHLDLTTAGKWLFGVGGFLGVTNTAVNTTNFWAKPEQAPPAG